ncbi:MAG: sugar O-acetyltransferase [Rhizobiaceae bacterium]|nr:sugar O-acetyltransferase [Rhizobiaceae bacterium]MCV0405326.1 sugar O-acetyltransferase [Rhizobiaceae bacterium]
MASEREKMARGEWYRCLDPELDALRETARAAVHAHNTLHPAERGAMAPDLRRLFGVVADDAFIEAPFHCAYGFNIDIAAKVYFNAGCVILDTAPVRIGAETMFGPGVHIYCADHHRDPELRTQGFERALPVTIGARVWIGGGAIILPGVTIGNGAIVGAGAVVTRDVAAGTSVVGNPAKPKG